MMPGPHMPPVAQGNQGRRHGEYHYIPPPSHSPVPLPYGNYHPGYHGHHPSPQYVHPHNWYNPYQPHYPAAPRHYQQQPPPPPPPQHQTPLVVSSHQGQHYPNFHRQHNIHTPPIVSSSHTPQPRSSTPAPAQPLIAPSTPADIARAAAPSPSLGDATTVTTDGPDNAAVSSASTAIPEPTPAASASPPVPVTPPPNRQSRQTPTSTSTEPPPTVRTPFYPELPWLSVPDQPFPSRAANRRRRMRRHAHASSEALQLPSVETRSGEQKLKPEVVSQATAQNTHSDSGTNTATSGAPSDADSTHPTTPSSATTTAVTPRASSSATHARNLTRPAVPLVPIPQKAAKPNSTDERPSTAGGDTDHSSNKEQGPVDVTPASSDNASATPPPTGPKAPPKSWADLVRSKVSAPSQSPQGTPTQASASNGAPSKSNSLSEVLEAYTIQSENKVSFLEPRGLVNTGNMCYMNSILQVLVFCIPFYDFLDQVGKRAAHSFKSETPLLDAMILFMREYSVIDSAASAEQLRLRLKDQELEQYGEAFIPEYVYEVIRRLPRFSSMRRGHQQDAEEFLGFLLEALHDECAQIMKGKAPDAVDKSALDLQEEDGEESGWLEVGPRQKAAVTRSSGFATTDTPVTRIFGGNLRSEFRVPGLKNSVTLEPYKPLQLDIGNPRIRNIVDAIKGHAHSETIQGDFNRSRGPGVAATKQVFIDTLPPVLILHLKRFEYKGKDGTQKIWKRVGYPLELELPKEVFPHSKRATLFNGPKGAGPRYRLIGVVYHHGKNASGGHYTVDVRRQDGREWIRLDDTVIRRIRGEEVAEAGAEDDSQRHTSETSRDLTAALESHETGTNSTTGNRFEQMGATEDGGDSNLLSQDDATGWKEVNGASNGSNAVGRTTKKWAQVANGTATPNLSTGGKASPRAGKHVDKVAYILFYRRV